MNLNKDHKSAIVNAIMADVPVCDYKKMIRDYVQAEALKLMPAAVLALYNDEGLRPFVSTMKVYGRYYETTGNCGTIHWICPNSAESTLYMTHSPHDGLDPLTKLLLATVRTTVLGFCDAAEKQKKDRESMREKLDRALLMIRTLKQAKTLLEPDLHKYLPPEPPKVDKNAAMGMAVVPYVVDSLKEMGWPKEQVA